MYALQRRKRAAIGLTAAFALAGMAIGAGIGGSGCAGNPGVGMPEAKMADAAAGAPAASGGDAAAKSGSTATPAAMPRKIIYSAEVEITADSLTAAAQKIAQDAAAHGGYIADSDVSGAAGSRRQGTWKIRVPAAQFSAFLHDLGSVGDLENTKVQSEDVSEEYYDVDARIRNKQLEEARLLEHLKASTGRLSDILAIERELSRVREEIERMQGRLRFLANQTDLSTVTITVHEREEGGAGEAVLPFSGRVARTFQDSVDAMGAFVRGAILAIVALLPWAIVGGAIVTPFYLQIRRRRRERGPGNRPPYLRPPGPPDAPPGSGIG